MAKKKFSDLPATTSIGASDLLATSQVDADAQSGYTSKKITGGNVARSINAGIEYPTDLETEDKTIIGAINEINSKALAIDSASGDIASFDTAISAPLVSLSTTIVAKGGGGTPSTPIPIVGHSELNLTRCGKNFLPSTYKTTTSNNIRYFWNATGGGLLLKANVTYCISVTQGSTHPAAIYVQDYNSGTELTHVYSQRSVTYTPTEDIRVRFDIYYANSDLPTEPLSDINCQVEVGSTATAYEPYNGQTITIALGQTVYGGRLYIENGWKCEVTHTKLTFNGSENWTTRESVVGTLYELNITEPIQVVESISNMYLWQLNLTNNDTFRMLESESVKVIAIHDDNRTDLATFKSFLSNNNLTICCKLATPFTIDLSSSDMLDAVVGINNVFSDCGVTSLTFIDKMQHYVDKKIAELQALILQ